MGLLALEIMQSSNAGNLSFIESSFFSSLLNDQVFKGNFQFVLRSLRPLKRKAWTSSIAHTMAVTTWCGHYLPYLVTTRTITWVPMTVVIKLHIFHVLSCEMFTFYYVLHEIKKGKQPLENAQYRLKIIFEQKRGHTWLGYHTILATFQTQT